MANVVADADPVLQIFLLLLVAVGFLATALTRTDPWVWTLGLGMGWVGLQFVTPMGERMSSALDAVGVIAATALALAAAALYATAAIPTHGHLRPPSTGDLLRAVRASLLRRQR